MEIHIRLLGQPKVLINGIGKPVSVRGLGRVFVFLVLLRGTNVGRDEMAKVLWPGEDSEVSANRLRVSLNRVRNLIGDHLYADRERIGLVGVVGIVDIWEWELRLQAALDEVDFAYQKSLLLDQLPVISGKVWSEFEALDLSDLPHRWEQLCRDGLRRLSRICLDARDWESVDSVWNAAIGRGNFDQELGEYLLRAYDGRGRLEDGIRALRLSARELKIDIEGEKFAELRTTWQKLGEQKKKPSGFASSHFQLLGSALLKHIDLHAEVLADLLVSLEVQLAMQAVPLDLIKILEAIRLQLEVGSPRWIAVEAARLSAYGSVYDSEKMLEISESLLQYEMTGRQAGNVWMIYAFSLFQYRRWDEALTAIRSCQQVSEKNGTPEGVEIGRLTEAAFLWHLGEVETARTIYDSYLVRFEHSESFAFRVNWAISQFNYAVLELIYGDIWKARDHVDNSFGERENYNLDRLMPNLLSLMGVIYGRCGEINKGIEYAIEGLKLTYWRGASREGQINLEWACGLLVLGGFQIEALSVLEWVDAWRQSTGHTRAFAEKKYVQDLQLDKLTRREPLISISEEYRVVMAFTIRHLRLMQEAGSTSRVGVYK